MRRVELSGQASLATQEDRAANPLDYRDDYYHAELFATVREWSAGAGLELLEGDGTKGFSTPLATLHPFQGWADKFLTTPADGVRDSYATLRFTGKPLTWLDSLSAVGTYHAFESDRGSTDYGTEIDLQLQAKWRRWSGMLKYADYRADSFATDTRKVWVQLELMY